MVPSVRGSTEARLVALAVAGDMFFGVAEFIARCGGGSRIEHQRPRLAPNLHPPLHRADQMAWIGTRVPLLDPLQHGGTGDLGSSPGSPSNHEFSPVAAAASGSGTVR